MENINPLDFKLQNRDNLTGQDRVNFDNAIKYIEQNIDSKKILENVINKKVKIEIIHDGDDRYVPSNNTIYWDPRSGVEIKDAGGKVIGVQSAAIGLLHEAKHSVDAELLKVQEMRPRLEQLQQKHH